MYMSDEQIRESWAHAANQQHHTQVLADLNGTDLETMAAKLEELGLECQKSWQGVPLDKKTVRPCKGCETCTYRAAPTVMWGCEYRRITGQLRGALNKDGTCPKFKRGPMQPAPKVRPTTRKKQHRVSRSEWLHKQARALYDQGLSDRQIGDEIGVSAKTIWRWRRDKLLPAQQPGRHHEG